MLKQFLKNGAMYSAVGVLARGVSFLLLPFYTRVLSPKDYGIIDILAVFGSFAAVTVALEISQALPRFFVDARSETEQRTVASTAFWFSIIAYTLFVLVSVPLSSYIAGRLLREPNLWNIIPLSLCTIWSNGVANLLLLLLVYQLRPVANAVSSLTITILSIMSTIALVLVFHLGVRGVLAGQIIGNVAGGIVALIYARNTIRPSINRSVLWRMIRYSVPLVPASVGSIASQYINRIAVMRLMTLADVGVLGVGYRLTSIVPLLMGGIQTAIAPLVYNNYRRPEAPYEIARILRFLAFGSLLFFVILSLFAVEALRIMAAPVFQKASAVIPTLAFAAILSKIYDFAPGLFIAKRTGIVALINIAGAGINIILNIILIPQWGISGAAWANCLSAACVFGCYIVWGHSYYPIPYDSKALIGSLAVSVLFVLAGRALTFPSIATVIAVKIAICFIIIGVFVGLKLVTKCEIHQGLEQLRIRVAQFLKLSARKTR